MVTRPGEHIDTVVVGGGQAGLAVGYHLRQRDRSLVILEADDAVGGAWRRRWDSLRLFTTARYDGLPGAPFPAPRHTYPTKDDVADYLEAYATRFDLPVQTGVHVDRVARDGDRFVVEAGVARWTARNVVVATGPYRTPRIPDLAADLDPSIVQLHSSEYRNPSQLRDGDVLVVGAGNSGAEIALELSQHHRTWLSGRDTGQEPTRAGSLPDRLLQPVYWFVASRVVTADSAIGRKVREAFLHPPRGVPLGRVRRGDLRAAGITRLPRTSAVRDGQPVVGDDRTIEVANVVWCTGFVMDLGWIELPVADRYGVPIHDRGVVGDQPGLYFVGLPFQSSLSSALLGGVGRDAAYVAGHIAARATDRSSAWA